MLRHAAHYDSQNRRVWEAETRKLANGFAPAGPPLPNNQARLIEARKRQAQLSQAKTAIIDKVAKLLTEKEGLKPYRFDPAGYNMRAEMRQLARSMGESERMAPGFGRASSSRRSAMTREH